MKSATVKMNAVLSASFFASAYGMLGLGELGLVAASSSALLASVFAVFGAFFLIFLCIFPILVTVILGNAFSGTSSPQTHFLSYAPWGKYFVIEKDESDE